MQDQTTRQKTWAKLGLLATLYFSQGLPFGFFIQALPVLLRKQGLSLPAIGLTSLLALPWALKFLWAPWVDRAERRKSWIVPLQLGAAVVMCEVALLDPSGLLWLVLASVLITNLLAATQDVATDGLAIDMLDYDERGLGNGVQVAGYRVGMIVGGGALLILFDYLGWSMTFFGLAALLVVATIPVLMHKEPHTKRHTKPRPAPGQEPPRHDAPSERVTMSVLLDFIKRPGMWRWIVAILLFKSGDALVGGMLRPFLVDVGLREADIGWMLGAAGFTSGLLGAVAGGWATGKLGRTRALILFGLLQTLGGSMYAINAVGVDAIGYLYAACIIEHFTGGLATAAIFTMMMDACSPDTAGSDYTLQASIFVLVSGVGAASSGLIAAKLDYAALFWLGGVIGLVGMFAIARMSVVGWPGQQTPQKVKDSL